MALLYDNMYVHTKELIFSLQSLDFAATVHILHFLLCLCYGGFPLSWAWWVTTITSVIVMTLVGEWLCWRTELKAIPLSEGGGRG